MSLLRVEGLSIRYGDEVAVEVIDRFEAFLKGIGVETRMSECGVTTGDIDVLLEDSVRVYFGPDGTLGAWVPATPEDVRKVLEIAL